MTKESQTGWLPTGAEDSSAGLAMLHSLFHAHPDMMFVTDRQGSIVAANTVSLKALGYRRPDIEGQPIHKLIPAALPERYAARARKLSNPSNRTLGSEVDVFIRDAKGKECAVDVTLSPFSAGAAHYVLVICRKMEEDVAQKQNQIHALVENARDYAVILLDTHGKILTWNNGAEQFYGHSASEAIGRDHSILFSEREQQAGEPQRQLKIAMNSVQPVLTEGWHQNPAGAAIWVESRCIASRDGHGNVTGFTRVIHDMTARKIIEAQLQDANRALGALAADLENRVTQRTHELEASLMELREKKAELEDSAEAAARDLREKEVLLREVYHRVKNNLQVVQSLLKMRARTLVSIEARDAIDAAVHQIQVMATVHENLYQRQDLARLTLPAYLKDIINGAVQSNETRSDSCVDVEIAAEEIPINLDLAIPLGLLVNELVSNCLKHGLRDTPVGQIQVSIARKEEAVRLVIQDSGRGLPKDFDVSKTRSMGLKLANSLAGRLGGQLRFSSENGCRVEADLTRL